MFATSTGSFAPSRTFDVLCFSHLRWDFVFQRPQHLLSRFARHGRVFYVEEPVFGAIERPFLEVMKREHGLHIVKPWLPQNISSERRIAETRRLLDELMAHHDVDQYVAWYYTPAALHISRHLSPLAIVYDCMDELSAFRDAPPSLLQDENELLQCADLVFTGGHSLYGRKSPLHRSVWAFPSSIDASHFERALQITDDPPDQAAI